MSQFTVIDNRVLHAAPTTAPRRGVEFGDVQRLLTDRLLHVTAFTAGIDPFQVARATDPASGALVLTSGRAHRQIAALRAAHPDLPMILEPKAIRDHTATPEEPFLLPQDDDLLIRPSLEGALDLQLMNGNPIALTPTGQITAGDVDSLKAALKMANTVRRPDTLFMLPVTAAWLSNELHFRLLQKVVQRSELPVAIAIIDRKNGIESGIRLRRYRELIADAQNVVVAWRVDLVGFDALAHGALAASIGAHPSARRLNPVGRGGRAMDPEDLAPHMLVTDLLGFKRSKVLRQSYFADAPALLCSCPVCQDAPIDRLFGSTAERCEGHAHNVHELNRLFEGFKGGTRAERSAHWTAVVRAALDEYPALETHIGKQLKLPADLRIWRDAL